MATTAFQSAPVHTVGDLPAVGSVAPEFDLVGQDLGPVSSADLRGKKVILNIFPSIDTGTCQATVRHFNEAAAGLENTTVLCVSHDLPFAQARFCGAEGINDVVTASGFRSSFGKDFGLTMTDGPLEGLLARAVFVLDETGKIVYSELVPEISHEPDYDSALAALKQA